MTLNNFIKEYCKDILSEYYKYKDIKQDMFSYDEIIYDTVSGSRKVIVDEENNKIAIDDIFELDDIDFKTQYPSTASLLAYTKYISNYDIISGEELLRKVQKQMKLAREELSKYGKKTLNDMFGDI